MTRTAATILTTIATTITTTEARRGLGRILERVARGEDVVITRRGVPCAVLVSVERYGVLVHAEVSAGIAPAKPRRGRRRP